MPPYYLAILWQKYATMRKVGSCYSRSVPVIGSIPVFKRTVNWVSTPQFWKKIEYLVQCSAEAAFLPHCPTNCENDTAKTGPAGHLTHTDFGLAQEIIQQKLTYTYLSVKIMNTSAYEG